MYATPTSIPLQLASDANDAVNPGQTVLLLSCLLTHSSVLHILIHLIPLSLSIPGQLNQTFAACCRR
jgi:hypothetical protein